MGETFHQLNDGEDQCLVHTEDMDPPLAEHIAEGVGNVLNSTAVASHTRKSYVYRKMCESEFQKVIQKQGLDLLPNKSEMWVTESLAHTRQFNNRGVRDPQVAAEIALPRQDYKGFREGLIRQAGSKSINKAQVEKGLLPYNVYNTERLKDLPGKRNIGFKGRGNVEKFNTHVISVQKVDPHSVMNQTKATRWLRRNKLKAGLLALGVVLDGAMLTISMIQDGGVGKQTAISIADIGGGHLGGYLGGLIGSALFPGIGTIVGAFIGGVLGSILGGGLVSFFLGFNTTAPGPGQPKGESMPSGRGQPKGPGRHEYGQPGSYANVESGQPLGESGVTHGQPSDFM